MKVITTIKELCRYKERFLRREKVGFVPTMGCLHEGHLCLVREAKRHHSQVVVSIFVNPYQFEAHEDYDRYPQTLHDDLQTLTKEGVHAVFCPKKEELYPKPVQNIRLTSPLTKRYCGKKRPHHFEGVLKVVAQLLHLVEPESLYLGEKDYQQLVLIRMMVEELHFNTKVRSCPTVRHSNGLAMSSRNRYLSPPQKQIASNVYQTLRRLQHTHEKQRMSLQEVNNFIRNTLELENDVTIEYINIVDAVTLKEVTHLKKKSMVLIAYQVNNVRLIDNIRLEGRA